MLKTLVAISIAALIGWVGRSRMKRKIFWSGVFVNFA
jgi:hypothetical protein